MNKIKILIVVAIVIMLSGCKDYGEKRIVKLLTVDQSKVSIYYYDYSKEEVDYLKEEREYTDIGNVLTDILSEEDYELKLCQYVVVEKEVIHNKLNELFFSLTNSKFSPDIAIIETENPEDIKKYIDLKQRNYPIYTYCIDGNTISGVIENPDTMEKDIIISDNVYKILTPQQSFIFDIINKKINKGIYFFENEGKKYSINFDNLDVYCYVKDDILYMNFSGNIKNYKGAPSGDKDKKKLIELAQKNIQEVVSSIISDDIIAEKFNILWYRQVDYFDSIIININID